jgi:septation ring formation regulator EzrA
MAGAVALPTTDPRSPAACACLRPGGDPLGTCEECAPHSDAYTQENIEILESEIRRLRNENSQLVSQVENARAEASKHRTNLGHVADYLGSNVERLSRCLEKVDWRPSRAHIEGARNSMASAENTIRQSISSTNGQSK